MKQFAVLLLMLVGMTHATVQPNAQNAVCIDVMGNGSDGDDGRRRELSRKRRSRRRRRRRALRALNKYGSKYYTTPMSSKSGSGSDSDTGSSSDGYSSGSGSGSQSEGEQVKIGELCVYHTDANEICTRLAVNDVQSYILNVNGALFYEGSDLLVCQQQNVPCVGDLDLTVDIDVTLNGDGNGSGSDTGGDTGSDTDGSGSDTDGSDSDTGSDTDGSGNDTGSDTDGSGNDSGSDSDDDGRRRLGTAVRPSLRTRRRARRRLRKSVTDTTGNGGVLKKTTFWGKKSGKTGDYYKKKSTDYYKKKSTDSVGKKKGKHAGKGKKSGKKSSPATGSGTASIQTNTLTVPCEAAPTAAPSTKPLVVATEAPTFEPTAQPTGEPTPKPTSESPTLSPTFEPTSQPTLEPTTDAPTFAPTLQPTVANSAAPTATPPTGQPSENSLLTQCLEECNAQYGNEGIFGNGDNVPEYESNTFFNPNADGIEDAWVIQRGGNPVCFQQGYAFKRWGWNHQLLAGNSYTFDVYIRAKDCDLEYPAAVNVGTVIADLTLFSQFTITTTFFGGAKFESESIHLSQVQYPTTLSGRDTVMPSTFAIKQDYATGQTTSTRVIPTNWSGETYFYFMYHFDVEYNPNQNEE